MELATILTQNALPGKRLIHDCVDTGTPVALSQNATVAFTVDCAGRDYKTGANLWTPASSSFKNHIDDGLICFKIRATINGGNGTIITAHIIVPHPTFGDIFIADHDWVCYKNNIDTNFEWSSFVYMGTDSEAKTYGFKVLITPSAAVTMKARSILVIA